MFSPVYHKKAAYYDWIISTLFLLVIEFLFQNFLKKSKVKEFWVRFYDFQNLNPISTRSFRDLSPLRTGGVLRQRPPPPSPPPTHTPCLISQPLILWSWNLAHILAIGTHKRNKMVKIFSPEDIFAGIIRNSECMSIFGEINNKKLFIILF